MKLVVGNQIYQREEGFYVEVTLSDGGLNKTSEKLSFGPFYKNEEILIDLLTDALEDAIMFSQYRYNEYFNTVGIWLMADTDFETMLVLCDSVGLPIYNEIKDNINRIQELRLQVPKEPGNDSHYGVYDYEIIYENGKGQKFEVIIEK